ncbi:DNA/RNA nuclease SfsA [Caldiplasma sukawensis]
MMKFRKPESGTSLLKIDGDMLRGKVVKRLNRFAVSVETEMGEILCHLHDPGRLKELIFPGSDVIIRRKEGEKTSYSITYAVISDELVLIDKRFDNKIAENFMEMPFFREVSYRDSRFDFSKDSNFVEVKGCSMKVNSNTVVFPDAPSKRASKHISQLTEMKKEGKSPGIIFLIFREADFFYPNFLTDSEFSKNFFSAVNAGMDMLFPVLKIKQNSVILSKYASVGKNPFTVK